MEEKRYKTIFNAGVARFLLKSGNSIVDLRKDKDNPSKTNFVFEYTEKLGRDLASVQK